MKYEIGSTTTGVKILKTNGAQTLEKLKFTVKYECCGIIKTISYKAMETRRRGKMTKCMSCAMLAAKQENDISKKPDYGIVQPTWPATSTGILESD